MMSKEAIAHYEAALKEAFPRGATGEVFHHWNEARYLIATEALDRMAKNARELGLDYDVKSDHRLMEQPAQHEPVGEVLNERGEVDWFSFVPTSGTSLYLRSQAREPLTDEEIDQLLPEIVSGGTFTVITYGRAVARAIEAAHGIKENT